MMPMSDITLIHFDGRRQVYSAFTITGVHLHGSRAVSVGDKGVNTADLYTIRIPAGAGTQGRDYCEAREFDRLPEADRKRCWTIAHDDAVIFGLVSGDPAELSKQRDCTVIGLTDNRRGSPALQHWRVTAK